MDYIVKKLRGNLKEWKPIPFWSWNAKLEKKHLCEQIDEMKQWGIGGYFMHARGGLKTEYLSEEWMQCVEACVEHGNQIGMGSWIYDENGWPSGFAGGKLLEHEEDRDKYLKFTIGEFDTSATVHYELTDTELIPVSQREESKEYLNLFIRTSVNTADILNPSVTDRFLEMTHEQYKSRFGGDLRGKIRGVFTDEPQYHRARTPYTNIIREYWKETYGEEILDKLGLLFVEKEGYREFRYRYWKGIQHLMLQNYSKRVYEWCETNGIEFTGHYVEEVSMGTQLMCCGGVMPFYEYMHIPGIDWLYKDTDNELPQRQIASVAAQCGKKKILTETFGCCGWQVTPAELKRIAEFQMVAGVNLLCHHLFPYEEYGQRKRDYPAHFSGINPWIPAEFASFNQYFTRLGYLISESKECVNVAVLHPIRSAYFDYKREWEDTGYGIAENDKQLQEDIRLLSSNGINYHFLDETLLEKHGFVKGKTIGCGQCAYSYLVLPHVLTMDLHTKNLIERYMKNGGKVLILGEVPKFLEAEYYTYDWLESNCTFEEIMHAQMCRVTNQDTQLYQTYRIFDGKPLIFIQNASAFDCYTQHFELGEEIQSFAKMDLLTLEHRQVPLDVCLSPGESAVLFPSKEPVAEQKTMKKIAFIPKDASVSYEENCLVVDHVRYSFDGKNYSKPYWCVGLFSKLLEDRTEGDIWFKYEFEVREIPENIYLKAEACGAKGQWLNGKEITFESHMKGEPHFLMTDVHSYLQEGINEYVVKINWFQSADVYYALFGKGVTEGLGNKLVYDNELEAIYLCGRFGVWSDEEYEDAKEDYVYGEHFWIGREPTHVTEPITDGFPFLAGNITLKQKLYLKEKDVMLQVKGNYLVAYVKVNGHEPQCLMFEQEADISSFACVGENDVEVTFIISNRNLFGPHHILGTASRGFMGPSTMELRGWWENGESIWYGSRYELLTLACGMDLKE